MRGGVWSTSLTKPFYTSRTGAAAAGPAGTRWARPLPRNDLPNRGPFDLTVRLGTTTANREELAHRARFPPRRRRSDGHPH
jgi:hypothetical protein